MSGWREVSGTEAAALERELRREVPANHVLHGRIARAHARRDDCDDVAFEVDGAELWVVHLDDWRSERDPSSPHAVLVRKHDAKTLSSSPQT